MGVLASTQRVPLGPFQSYQTWRTEDVRAVLARFERDPDSTGFKVSQQTWASLVKDLPVSQAQSQPQSQPQSPQSSRHRSRIASPAHHSGGVALPPINVAAALAAAAAVPVAPAHSPTAHPQPHPPSTPRAPQHGASPDQPEEKDVNSITPHPPPPRPPAAMQGVSFHSFPQTPASPSPTMAAGISIEAQFNAWVGPDLKDDGRLDVLIFAAAVTCMCRARYADKMRLLFELFDFDADGILNRGELAQLVRGVAVGLHRIYGVGVHNPASFVFQTSGDGHDRSTGAGSAAIREPNLKQCERWNEQHVRRFEAALRTGLWNIDGWLEWASSSALAVHLLGVGMRTRIGTTATIDALRVQAKLFEAQQRMQPIGGYGNAGGSIFSVPVKFATREDELLGITQRFPQPPQSQATSTPVTPRTSRGVSAVPKLPSSGSTSALPPPLPRAQTLTAGLMRSSSSTGSTSVLPSQASAAASRFKFTGRNTAREVKNLKQLFDSMDIDSSGFLSLEYLRRPKKYTDPFLLRDITSVFQEWKGPPSGTTPTVTPTNAASVAAAGGVPHAHVTEVSFSDLLDVLYRDLTPDEHKLLHSWVPAPINKESVKSLQAIFDRLDSEFTGRVKFAKVMAHFRTEHADNETYQKLMEPFSRLRPHRLEIAVNIRELLTAFFNRTHPKQLKKILAWSRPSKLLTHDQQNELVCLFQRYDTRNEGRFPIAHLKRHLLERGLPPDEVEEMMQDIQVQTESQLHAQALALAAAQSHQPTRQVSDSSSAIVTSALVAATTDDVVPPDEPMITLQEFQIFYRDLWDSYVNFDLRQPHPERS